MKYFKPFVKNLCKIKSCTEWECEECPHFKPKFLGIPIPKKIGKWLYELEEKIFFKVWLKNYPLNTSEGDDFK